MEYEFKFGNQQYAVNIEQKTAGNLFSLKAVINDEVLNLELTPTMPNCYLLKSGNQNLRAYAALDEKNVYVFINGRVIKLSKILGDQQKYSHEGLEFGAKDQVSTPMPGKVVKILVVEGEKVALKQPLVIVESMKMENEIKSPANGTIKSIHFKAGDLVESGQPIIKIVPD